MQTPIRIELDTSADAAYIALSDNEVASTRQLTPEVLVDLDEFDVVTGIEILGLEAPIPFDRLSDVHVRSEVMDLIKLISPSVGGFALSVTSRPAGSATSSPAKKQAVFC